MMQLLDLFLSAQEQDLRWLGPKCDYKEAITRTLKLIVEGVMLHLLLEMEHLVVMSFYEAELVHPIVVVLSVSRQVSVHLQEDRSTYSQDRQVQVYPVVACCPSREAFTMGVSY
jgi:hypothetical protein